MASRVQVANTYDGGTAYSFGPMRLYLYDDYMIWKQGVLGVQESTIYYKDIISVSYSNGGLFANAYFQINTAGQIYNCGFTCAASGLELIDQDIRERQASSSSDIDLNELLKALMASNEKENKIAEESSSDIEPEEVTKEIQDIETKKIAYVANVNPENVEPTITRIELLLEDREWERTKVYIETALDYFPTDYRLYLFSLCADNEIESIEDLGTIIDSLQEEKDFKRVRRFASEEDLDLLERTMFPVQYEKYHAAINLKEAKDYFNAWVLFTENDKYRDSLEQARLIEAEHKEDFYQFALKCMNEGDALEAMKAFQAIAGYKDSDEYCRKLQNENKIIAEKVYEDNCESQYQQAVSYKENGKIAEAYALFLELCDYKDSEEQAQLCWESL